MSSLSTNESLIRSAHVENEILFFSKVNTLWVLDTASIEISDMSNVYGSEGNFPSSVWTISIYK